MIPTQLIGLAATFGCSFSSLIRTTSSGNARSKTSATLAAIRPGDILARAPGQTVLRQHRLPDERGVPVRRAVPGRIRPLVVLAFTLLTMTVLGLVWFNGRQQPAPSHRNAELVWSVTKGDANMAVIKVLELVGESHSGWQDAVAAAVREASRTVKGITGVEVYHLTANVSEGSIAEYKANVKVAFAVDPQMQQR